MVKNTKINKAHYSLIDIYFLILAPIVATIITLLLPLNLLESTLLLFGVPALYISCRKRDIVKRSLIYATPITIISILTDYLAERDQSWVSSSIFNIRLAGSVPIEALVWVFLLTYLIVIYYQYFFDVSPHKLIGKRMPYVFFAALTVLVWLCLAVVVDIQFTIDYYYIKFGLAFVLFPLIAFVLVFPHYLSIFLKMGTLFYCIRYDKLDCQLT